MRIISLKIICTLKIHRTKLGFLLYFKLAASLDSKMWIFNVDFTFALVGCHRLMQICSDSDRVEIRFTHLSLPRAIALFVSVVSLQ